MHLVLHIGDHKTGTTSIQVFLRQQAAELASAGIFVPEACTYSPESGHHNLAFQLRNDKRWKPENGGIDELLAELRSCRAPRAVISCEDLSLLVSRPSAMERLESALRGEGHTLSWLMFLRRVDDYSESLYCELLKMRHRPSWGYPGFVLSGLLNGHYLDKYFDHAAFVRRWTSQSDSPLHLVDYDRCVQTDGVLPSFLRAIGAPEALIALSRNHPIHNQQRLGCLRRYRTVMRPLLRARFHRSNQRLTAGNPQTLGAVIPTDD